MKFRKLTEAFEVGNKMVINIGSSVNTDGCTITVTNEADEVLYRERYAYGYNASYNRKHAKYAQDDYDNAIKYDWQNKPSLKPFIGDIVHDLCAQYDINEDDIIYEKGKHLFMNTDASDADVDRFKSYLKESTDGYKKGDRVELSNGQTGIVAADYVVGEDRVAVDIEDMDERKYPLVDTLRSVADEAIAKPHDSSNDYTEADVERIRREFEEAGFNASSYNGYDIYTLADDSDYVGKCVFNWKFANPRTNAFNCELKYTVKKKKHFAAPSIAIDFLRSGVYDKGLHESFEMASIGAGLDDNGEIAAMRAEQAELEQKRAARKERFALMHKLFDKHMDKDPNAHWIDKIYHIFDTAESTIFVGSKHGTIPARTEDKQPIRYRYSIEEYDFYTDPYWEIVYIATNNIDPLKEDLEDEFDLLMKASEFKCKLSRYDIEEASSEDELIIYMEDVYNILADEYGAENIKWWKFYEDDDVDFGYKVCLKDGSKHIVEINNDRVDEINEAVVQESADAKPQYVICGITNDGCRMLYDAVNDNFTTDYDSATKYDDMEVARDDWFKIPRSEFRRIFTPDYDPAIFECVTEAFDADKVQKRIACTTEFDNGHVFHNDYFRASSAEAEERARQASIENPDKVFYVKYDDVMNPSSDIKWKNGEQLNEADEPIYFDSNDEFEVDFRYYVYGNENDVVSDSFDFEEDAIQWAKENHYPIVKIHNYYRDTDGQLNPDGDPEVVWRA